MKVNIGPYKKYWGYYNVLYLLRSLGVSEEKINNIYDKSPSFIDDIFRYLNKIFYFERKIKVKIDYYDTWNMDYTLALIILPMLEKIRANKDSSPPVDDEDVPEELRKTNSKIPYSEENGEVDEFFFNRWDYVLDEMIYSFRQIANENSDDKFYTENSAGEYNVDLDGLKEFENRINNGLRLFGKYYRNLWC